MLKNRALEIRVKKDTDDIAVEPKKPLVTPDEIAAVAKKVVTYVAVGLMGTMAAASILNTASEITVHKFTSEPDN